MIENILDLFSKLLIGLVNTDMFMYFMGCFCVIWTIYIFSRLR